MKYRLGSLAVLLCIALGSGGIASQEPIVEYREIYNIASGQMLYGDWYNENEERPKDVDRGKTPGTQEMVVLDLPPTSADRINKRVDLGEPTKLRDATQEEIDAVVLSVSNSEAQQFIQSREIRALIWEIIEAVSPPANATKFNNTINNLKETWRDQPWQ